VPRHVARLVTRLVAPLVVDYSALRRLVVDYFTSAARPGASARRAARRAARRQLLHLRRASGCLGTSRGSSRSSSCRSSSTTPVRADSLLTTSPPPCVRVPRHVARLVTQLVAPPVVYYFDNAARPGTSARRAARHTARRAARHRLLRLTQARCRLLRLRRASGCLGTSRGSSRGSSHDSLSTTSPPPSVRVPRHVARLVPRIVVRLVVD
jgi:hypothetical protein